MPPLINTAQTLVCFEHQALARDDFIDGRDFDWLLEQGLAVMQVERKQGVWRLKVGSYLGVIALPSGAMLEILPKIAQTTATDPNLTAHIYQTRQWLATMLTRVWDLPTKHLPTLGRQQQTAQQNTQQTLTVMTDDWLLAWLCHIFTQLWQHYTPNQRYHAHERNARTLQGKLLLREQLRHNAHQPTRFYQHMDERSADTACNRLVKAAYQRLFGMARRLNRLPVLPPEWYTLPTLQATYYDALWQQALQELQILPNIVATANRRLLDFCYDVLHTPQASAVYGETWQPTLLFNMNSAFEHWVSCRLNTKMADNATLDFQPNHAFAYADNNTLSIRPDVVMRHDNAVTVLEVKWKHIATLADVRLADLYQILVYAEELAAQQAWLVYPTLDPRQAAERIFFKQTRVLKVWRVPFCLLNEHFSVPPDTGFFK